MHYGMSGHFKALVAVLFLTLGLFSLSSTASAQTCHPSVLGLMKQQGVAVAQRGVQIHQVIITRPDPTAQMVCLAQQFIAAAALIGSIFSDNPQFSSACIGDSMITSVINAILKTLQVVMGVYNLGGGTLNTLVDTIGAALFAAVGAGVSNYIGGLVGNLIGGCLGAIAGNLVTGVISGLFPDPCNHMDRVWQEVALANVNRDYFNTIEELIAPGNDPRADAFKYILGKNGYPFGFQFDGSGATALFQIAVNNNNPSNLAQLGAFTVATMRPETWAPYSETGVCRETPIFAAFIACNRGCDVTGSYPNYSCAPP